MPGRFRPDPEVLANEEEKIFGRTWQLVGHRRQVEKAGDYFTTEVAGEPLLIVRDAEEPALT